MTYSRFYDSAGRRSFGGFNSEIRRLLPVGRRLRQAAVDLRAIVQVLKRQRCFSTALDAATGHCHRLQLYEVSSLHRLFQGTTAASRGGTH